MNALEFRLMRLSLFLTQPELATILGLKSHRTLQFWEAGRYAVPDRAADRLREVDDGCDEAAFIAMETFAATADEPAAIMIPETPDDMAHHWPILVIESRTDHPKVGQACALRVLKLLKHQIEAGRVDVEITACPMAVDQR